MRAPVPRSLRRRFPLRGFPRRLATPLLARGREQARDEAGVPELLDLLDQLRLPRAIATSSSRPTVERHLTAHGLTDRFDAIICRGDYETGKPAPDPFLKAAERLGVAPRLCLALEDSHIGVRSAAAAGMMTVMVPDLLEPTPELAALGIVVAGNLHEVRDLVLAAP
uniref:HAD family hydrolase n=1 Tax=Phenylobacterium glaciei TaxID=2803784 RepID=A0A974P687_9CAUL|nr:HAD family hydrolase [Phenylobacterium glaciei]